MNGVTKKLTSLIYWMGKNQVNTCLTVRLLCHTYNEKLWLKRGMQGSGEWDVRGWNNSYLRFKACCIIPLPFWVSGMWQYQKEMGFFCLVVIFHDANWQWTLCVRERRSSCSLVLLLLGCHPEDAVMFRLLWAIWGRQMFKQVCAFWLFSLKRFCLCFSCNRNPAIS